MTLSEVNGLIAIAHDPLLAKERTMVYQIWEDCEITLQKSGELLWQRNLHSIIPGIEGVNIEMPCKYNGHSYAFVTDEDAKEIRKAICEMLDIVDSYSSIL